MSTFKQRVQNVIDSTFEPTPLFKTKASFYDKNNIEYYDINYMTLKSLRKSNQRVKFEEPENQIPFFNTPNGKTVIRGREKSGNKLKDKANDFILNTPKIDFIHHNRPISKADRISFDYEHYEVNTPNNYKKNYYTSNFCRDYKPFKLTPSVYSPKYQSKPKFCDKGKDFFNEIQINSYKNKTLSTLNDLKKNLSLRK